LYNDARDQLRNARAALKSAHQADGANDRKSYTQTAQTATTTAKGLLGTGMNLTMGQGTLMF
jgi:hypothetical protein